MFETRLRSRSDRHGLRPPSPSAYRIRRRAARRRHYGPFGGRGRPHAFLFVKMLRGTRDAFVATGMEVGVQEGFRKLDTLLAH